MESPNTAYFYRLDHLRALAVLMVFFFEVRLRFYDAPIDSIEIPLIDYGQAGVSLFMVISGFLFAHIFGDAKINIRSFYLNRILRIYPLFVVVVLTGYYAQGLAFDGTRVLQALLALSPFSNMDRNSYGEFGGMFWSIAVELQFYLVFPFLWSWLREQGARGYAAVFGFLLIVRACTYVQTGNVHFLSYFTMVGCLDAFLFGCIVWEIRRRFPVSLPVLAPIAALAVLTLALHFGFTINHFYAGDLLNIYEGKPSPSWMWVIWPTIQAAVIGLFVFCYLAAQDIPRWRGLSFVGTISYSFYVWQVLIVVTQSRLLPESWPLTPYERGLLYLPAMIGFAYLSYELIEKPFLRRRIRYVPQPRPAEALAV